MNKTFYIIPCGGSKTATANKARDLYTGSMFKMGLAAAEAEARDMGGEVLILSALHGLVQLDTVLEPYDLKMGDEGSVTAERVLEQARELGMETEDMVDVYSFLPKAYFGVLDAALREIGVWAQDVYEADRGIGEQRHTCVVVRDTPALPAELRPLEKLDINNIDEAAVLVQRLADI
jgi:hypothetical protein